MNNKPELNSQISIQDFKDFYWYKEELIDFCRLMNLDKRGGKIEIANRIEVFLKTGERKTYHKTKTNTSRFDWNTANLSTETEITDNYKNTENVRAFFINKIGATFKFNVTFMNWMKCAQGRTLGDAIHQWVYIKNEMSRDKSHKQILPQFEYNTYIRDFMKDNPERTLMDAINCWNIKKSKPGHNTYSKSDLK